MRTKNQLVPEPKPITLGVLESMAFMSNGVVPRRRCHACAVASELLGYCLLILMVVGVLHFAKSIILQVLA